MGDIKFQGSSGPLYSPKDTDVRQINKGTSDEAIKNAIKDNNLDEVVVKDKEGKQFIVYADELDVKDGKMPKAGDKITVPFVDGPVEVTHVDDEWNEDWTAFLSSGALGALALGRFGQLESDDSAIRAISGQLGKTDDPVSAEEKAWADALVEKDKNGHKPSQEELVRFSNITRRVNAEKTDAALNNAAE